MSNETDHAEKRDQRGASGALQETGPEKAGKAAAVILSAVPVVGGTLGAIASEVVARRQNHRLQAFLKSLAEAFERLEDRVNADFLTSEEFQDLAEDAITKAAETRQEEKLAAIRAIFLNTILEDDPSYDRAAEFLALVDRWQPRHIILLRILSDPSAAAPQIAGGVSAGGSIQSVLEAFLPDWREGEIERTWGDLYDTGIHRTEGTRSMMSTGGPAALERLLSSFGEEVVAMILEPPME